MPAASSRSVWILGVAFVLGGFGAGYLVGQGGGAVPDDEPPPLERSTSPRAETAPVLTLGRAEPSTESEAHLDSARAAELEPLRQFLADLDPPDVPRGTGVITGTVRTEAGAALAGVEITLEPRTSTGAASPPGRSRADDLVLVVQAAIEQARWRHHARMRTRTSADGSYRFDAVAELDHRVRAELAGWRMALDDGRRASRARPGAQVDFVAKAVTRVPLTVLMPDGTAPESARVMVRIGTSFDFGSSQNWTAARPYVELTAGTCRVSVLTGGELQLKSEPQTVYVEPGVPPTPLRFELESRGGIEGEIAFAPGERFRGGNVSLVRIPEGQEADPSRLASSSQQAPLHASRMGSFVFRDLAPGRYLLGLSRTGQGDVVVTREVEVADEPVAVVLEVPPLRRDEYVAVTIRGPAGRPVTDARITVGRQHAGRRSSRSATVVEREDGSQWVVHHAGDGQPAPAGTTWFLKVDHRELGTVERTYDPASRAPVEIRLDKPGILELTLVGVAGSRYEGRVVASLGGAMPRGRETLDVDGHVTLPGVQPGTYPLTLGLDRVRGGLSEIHREQVEIRSGSNRLRIRLPPLHEVELRGVEGQGLLRNATREGPRTVRVFTAAADGRATIDGLPAGTYRVSSGSRSATFTLPGPTRVQLK